MSCCYALGKDYDKALGLLRDSLQLLRYYEKMDIKHEKAEMEVILAELDRDIEDFLRSEPK
jgi:hypothetical protein